MEIKPKLDTCDEILSAFTTMNSSVGGQIPKRYQRSLVSRLQQNLLVLFSLCRIREPPLLPNEMRQTKSRGAAVPAKEHSM